MPLISSAGIIPLSLADYVTALTNAFRISLGADMSTTPEAPQTQIIGALALEMARIDEAIIHTAAGLNLLQATARQLDDWGALLDLPRLPGTHSTVVLTLSGTPGTIVPYGVRVRNAAGAVFRTLQSVIILPSGTVDANAQSVEPGEVHADAGSLTTQLDVAAGWTGVSNALAAVPGRGQESNAAYRRRLANLTGVHARDSADAIRARVLTVDGVTAAIVRDNPTAAAVTVQGISIPARAVLAVVQGGTDRAVAEAIAQTKPVGIPSAGTTSVTGVEPGGNEISFTRVRPVRILVAITTAASAAFPPDGISRIQQRVEDWAVGQWSSGAGDFDTSGLEVGEGINVVRLYSPVNSVPGHTVSALAVTDAMGSALPSDTPLDALYTIAAADVAVTLS